MSKEARPKAYSYIRFSSPEQEKGDSRRRQVALAEEYAKAHGLDLDTNSYVDLGVSAYQGRNLTTGALGAFLEAVRNGDIPKGATLIVETLDRVSRQTPRRAANTMGEIVEAGINLVDLSDGGRVYNAETIDSGGGFDFLMMVLRFTRAHEESATKARRLIAAYDKKRRDAAEGKEAKPFTRALPAWIEWDDKTNSRRLIPERARVVKAIFEKAAKGWGQHKIAQWLNEKQTEPWGEGKRKAKYWHRSYVRKILTNSAAVGTFTPHRVSRNERGTRDRRPTEPIENYFPAAVDRALFEAVVARVGSRAPRGRNANTGRILSLVAGVATCAHCQGTVTRVSKGKYAYLVCSRAHAKAGGCQYLAVPYSAVETALTTNARAIYHDAPRGQETKAIERNIREAENRVDELQDATVTLAMELGTAKSEAVRRALRKAEQELEEAIENLRDLRERRDTMSAPTVSRRLRRLRDTLTHKPLNLKEANEALRDSVRELVVDPKTARLTIHWRHAEETTGDISFYSRHHEHFGVRK